MHHRPNLLESISTHNMLPNVQYREITSSSHIRYDLLQEYSHIYNEVSQVVYAPGFLLSYSLQVLSNPSYLTECLFGKPPFSKTCFFKGNNSDMTITI
jgi:hypothetical protein